jgi:mono/diheme cytochrome c family protein
VGAELYENNCRGCHGPQGEGIAGLCPPLNDRFFFDERLAEVGWSGTQQDYIISTIATGRMVSTRPELYAGGGKPAMPPWSDHYGGPLRDDQIQSIATFIMNWEPTAGQITASPAVGEGEAVGTDITVELPAGDPASGEALANSQGCLACHNVAAVAPVWAATTDAPGIGTRAAARLEQGDYTGEAETPEQYLFESIVNPHVFLADGFGPIMPNDYGAKLTPQDLADLVAYLLTLE